MRSHTRHESRGSRDGSQEGHSPSPDAVRPPQSHHPLTGVVIA
jgi:hypothetical protein